jgi:hypothetical protein
VTLPRNPFDHDDARALAAKTDFLEFEARPHLHMVAPDWQEVAAAVDSWLDGVIDAPSSPRSRLRKGLR